MVIFEPLKTASVTRFPLVLASTKFLPLALKLGGSSIGILIMRRPFLISTEMGEVFFVMVWPLGNAARDSTRGGL